MRYRDWEEAARNSRFEKAVGKTVVDMRGQRKEVEVIKPLHRDAFLVLPGTGFRVGGASPSMVDSITSWKPY